MDDVKKKVDKIINLLYNANRQWDLYDYVDHRGNNAIKIWAEGLQKIQRAKLNQKLDQLQQHGTELSTGLLSDTTSTDIKKIRIKGNVAVRLMLCKGPISLDTEFTLLLGATERDGRLVPEDAVERAEERRKKIIKEPAKKRCHHDRIS